MQQNLGGKVIFNLKFYTQGNYYSSVKAKYLFDMHELRTFTSYTPPNSYPSVVGFYLVLFPLSELPMYSSVINASCLLNEHPFPEEFKAENTSVFFFLFPSLVNNLRMARHSF